MPTPSLLIVPARFKTGKLYSQIPTSGAGDFTVTRNTAARRFDSSGLIASVASGIPRLDYYTSGGVTGCPALLVEPAATNLAFHSESWASGNNWSLDAVTRVTGSTDAFKAPDGSFTANAISPTSGNVFHGLFSNSPTQNLYASGTIYTQSAFFKAGGTNLPVSGNAGRYVQLTYTGGGQFTQNGYANFDLQLGTVTVVSGSAADTNRNARIENYGNGWYRCSFTATCNVSGNGVGVLPVLVNASGATRAQSFAGTVTDVLYGWGAQLETGSVATSYIPTTAGQGSRSADVISVSGAVSGSIGQTEGTIYAEVDFRNLGYNGVIATIQTNDWVADSIQIQKSLGNQWRFTIRAASTVIMNIDVGTITAGIYKVALAYNTATSGTVLAVNGSILSTQTASSLPACNSLVLGARNQTGTFSVHLNDRIRAVALYNTRLTDSELAALTAP